ncbi:hypothetical protein DVH24_027514 [Malus domestica]|uniref:Uncharacterized protein n=1 Tax=Malus domestica TaxID=3750 RepID=A0A498HDJ0_MALDO|nr:hypothetical protein DVH24_027514 [Malus domestica]
MRRDVPFRSTFGAPKTGGKRCSTGRVLGEFWFRLTPWNDLFHILQKSADHYTEAAMDEITILKQIAKGDLDDKKCVVKINGTRRLEL